MPAPKKNRNAAKGERDLKRFTVRFDPSDVKALKNRAKEMEIKGGYNALLQQIVKEFLAATRQT